MATRITNLLSILIFFGCGHTLTTENIYQQKDKSDLLPYGHLRTGWYYLSSKENGIEKILNKTNNSFFLNPNPIVTVDNFTELEIYQSSTGEYSLTIRLDEKGTEHWRIATGKSIGQKLALVIDNELFYMPIVNAQIDFGVTALNRGDLSEADLTAIKNKIEKEKK